MCFFILLDVTQQYMQCGESAMFHAGNNQWYGYSFKTRFK